MRKYNLDELTRKVNLGLGSWGRYVLIMAILKKVIIFPSLYVEKDVVIYFHGSVMWNLDSWPEKSGH